MRLQCFEQRRFADKSALLRKAIECLPQEGLCPLVVIHQVRAPAFVPRDLSFRLVNCRFIKHLANLPATALLRLLAIACIRDEMLQPAEEERTKAALSRSARR